MELAMLGLKQPLHRRGGLRVVVALVATATFAGGLFLSADRARAQEAAGDPAYENERYPDRLDGTLSAEGDLEADEAPRTGHFRFPTSLGPWLAFKEAVEARPGSISAAHTGFSGRTTRKACSTKRTRSAESSP